MACLVQQPAPAFKLTAVMPDDSFQEIELASYVGKKNVVLYTFSACFTGVSASEAIAFSKLQPQFEARDAQVLGLSVDTEHCQRAWKNAPEECGGIGQLNHPLLSDIRKQVCTAYSCLLASGLPLHATYIIDKKGIVRCEMKNDVPIGRGPEEVLRLLDALMFHQTSLAEGPGMVCPASWRPGQECMQPTLKGIVKYLRASHDDPKIADLARKAKPGWFSFEYYPPKSPDGISNLHRRIHRMKQLGPLFVDFTWGAGGSTSALTCELTNSAKNDHSCVANMHITCTNQNAEMVGEALRKCKQVGVRNIVALRGDPPRGEEKWEATAGGFSCALDLIKYTRKHFGDYFGISVAGYPEGHPDAIEKVPSFEELSDTEKRRARVSKDDHGQEIISVCRDDRFRRELEYLKEKCDAGGELVITQTFFDVQVYVDFLQACRDIGITVPIVPGILCLTSIGAFLRMTALCQTRLPEGMQEAAEKASNESEDAFKAWTIEFLVGMCRQLLDAGAPGLHFYTLNLEKVVIGTLRGLGCISAEQAAACAGDADARSMVSAQGITTDPRRDDFLL